MIYISFAAYLIGVGFWSVIPQVFWPEKAETDPSASCAEGLTDLQGELMARASERVARGGSGENAAFNRWLRGWDARHAGLEARCEGSGERAWVLLGRLRQRMHSTLERFDSGEGAIHRETSRALAELAP